jgi:DNA-binding transcriptional LysR family regulator
VIISKKGEACKLKSFEMCSKRGWVLHPQSCYFRESLEKLLSDRKLGFYINKELFGFDLQLKSILNGDGLGIYPKPFIDKFISENEGVEIVELDDFSLYLHIGVMRSKSTGANEFKWFTEIVKKYYSANLFVEK